MSCFSSSSTSSFLNLFPTALSSLFTFGKTSSLHRVLSSLSLSTSLIQFQSHFTLASAVLTFHLRPFPLCLNSCTLLFPAPASLFPSFTSILNFQAYTPPSLALTPASSFPPYFYIRSFHYTCTPLLSPSVPPAAASHSSSLTPHILIMSGSLTLSLSFSLLFLHPQKYVFTVP